MANKEVNIKVKADSKNAQKGLNQATESLNKFKKNIDSSSVAKFQKAFEGFTKTLSATGSIAVAVNSLKKLDEAIKEVCATLEVQLKAEKQLDLAIENSPYIDGSASKELKNFAGYLQSISNYGDEELMPMMAKLINQGFELSDVMAIMETSINVSAGSGKELESVIQAETNAFMGNATQLKKLLGTKSKFNEEELQNISNIREATKAFEGQAIATKDLQKNLEMTKGDFLEDVGTIFKPLNDQMITLWTNFYSNGSTVIKSLMSKVDEMFDQLHGKKNTQLIIDSYKNGMSIDYSNWSNKALDETAKHIENNIKENNRYYSLLQTEYYTIKDELRLRQEIEEQQKRETLAELEELQIQEKQATIIKTQTDLQKKYLDTVEKTKQSIQIKKDIGEEISKVDELTQLLNAKMNAYLSFVAGGGDASSNFAKNIVEDLKTTNQQINILLDDSSQKNEDTIEKIVNSWMDGFLEIKNKANEYLGKINIKSLSQEIKEEMEILQNELDKTNDINAYQTLTNSLEELSKLYSEVIEKEKKVKTADMFESWISNIQKFTDQYANIMSNLETTLTNNIETNLQLQQTALEKKLANGEISQEEYYKNLEELQKESAQKEYEIQMWAWTSQCLQASANIASSMLQVYSDNTLNTVGKIAMATTMATLGGLQLANVIASKPTAPSFATGGFLTGNSYQGDKIAFNGNAGEAILNAHEMRTFMAMANGEWKGSNSNVLVKNYMGGQAKIDTAIDGKDILIEIKKDIKSEIANGSWSKELISANSKTNGKTYF